MHVSCWSCQRCGRKSVFFSDYAIREIIDNRSHGRIARSLDLRTRTSNTRVKQTLWRFRPLSILARNRHQVVGEENDWRLNDWRVRHPDLHDTATCRLWWRHFRRLISWYRTIVSGWEELSGRTRVHASLRPTTSRLERFCILQKIDASKRNASVTAASGLTTSLLTTAAKSLRN